MRQDARDRAGWRGAATAVARGRMRLDGTSSLSFVVILELFSTLPIAKAKVTIVEK